MTTVNNRPTSYANHITRTVPSRKTTIREGFLTRNLPGIVAGMISTVALLLIVGLGEQFSLLTETQATATGGAIVGAFVLTCGGMVAQSMREQHQINTRLRQVAAANKIVPHK